MVPLLKPERRWKYKLVVTLSFFLQWEKSGSIGHLSVIFKQAISNPFYHISGEVYYEKDVTMCIFC
jgi:hypothetical protein